MDQLRLFGEEVAVEPEQLLFDLLFPTPTERTIPDDPEPRPRLADRIRAMMRFLRRPRTPSTSKIVEAILSDERAHLDSTDLRTMSLALEDRMRDHAGTPAGQAAARTRAKLEAIAEVLVR